MTEFFEAIGDIVEELVYIIEWLSGVILCGALILAHIIVYVFLLIMACS